MLTDRDVSSLVVDRLCDRARGQNTAVTCFYFDFAARKEHFATNTLGSLVKQVVCGMEKIPEEISQAFQEGRNAIGGRGPRLSDIVKMMQTIRSSLRSFACIDPLDECGQCSQASSTFVFSLRRDRRRIICHCPGRTAGPHSLFK